MREIIENMEKLSAPFGPQMNLLTIRIIASTAYTFANQRPPTFFTFKVPAAEISRNTAIPACRRMLTARYDILTFCSIPWICMVQPKDRKESRTPSAWIPPKIKFPIAKTVNPPGRITLFKMKHPPVQQCKNLLP